MTERDEFLAIHSIPLLGYARNNLLGLILGPFPCSIPNTCLYNVLLANVSVGCWTCLVYWVAFPRRGVRGMAHGCFLRLLDHLRDFLLVLAHQGRFVWPSFA